MEFFGGWFGGSKNEGRQNDGGDFMAVSGPENNYIPQNEAESAEERRVKKERLENLIVEIEGDPNHERRGELDALRDKLREMLQ